MIVLELNFWLKKKEDLIKFLVFWKVMKKKVLMTLSNLANKIFLLMTFRRKYKFFKIFFNFKIFKYLKFLFFKKKKLQLEVILKKHTCQKK